MYLALWDVKKLTVVDPYSFCLGHSTLGNQQSIPSAPESVGSGFQKIEASQSRLPLPQLTR